MNPITQNKYREVISDFAHAIRDKKTKSAKPSLAVINFRDDRLTGKERPIETVPIDLIRYRKDNGRIASDVMNYERLYGPLDEKDKNAQDIIRGFLEAKHREMTDILIKSIEHSGQIEAAIITCDGFLINGNRRKMAFEHLRKRFPGDEKYNLMKVVILPGPGDEGGPPTLLEIEHLENRYQLQNDGKSEYYGFDRALSIKRKMELGLSLEAQLRDDPRYVNATPKEIEKAVKQYEQEYILPLECVDRYLRQFGREGMYATVSSGYSDREGRWQAFIDYSNAYQTKLSKQQWQVEKGFDESDLGAVEEAAFKIIRLRTLKHLPKAHQVMRSLPKMCALKDGRKQILSIANEVDSFVPDDEQIDADGNPLSLDEIDKKWAHQSQSKLIMLTKKALEAVAAADNRETPLNLLEAALKKLTHENLVVDDIPHSQYNEARSVAFEIQKVAKDIEHQLYANEKKLKDLSNKK